tara:strand:+ start:185 stop:379 length:195 start_codon:yes stop_codon:yes gene_type:complete
MVHQFKELEVVAVVEMHHQKLAVVPEVPVVAEQVVLGQQLQELMEQQTLVVVEVLQVQLLQVPR